jgi:hypothetical protein
MYILMLTQLSRSHFAKQLVASFFKKFRAFVGPDGSVLSSQKHAIGFCPEPI